MGVAVVSDLKAIDVMGFAGSFGCGVEQAGFDIVAKREPDAFGGFGMAAWEANMPWVQLQVAPPDAWDLVEEEIDLLYGCPPCSGFSLLSTINTAESKTGKVVDGVRVAQRGIDSPDNIWMYHLIDYASKIAPPVVIFECVQGGGKLGAPLMRELWQRLRDNTGLDYHFTRVFMNAATVGGDAIRPRFFFVAHLRPFGVDLPRAEPRTLMEVIGDLPEEQVFDDPAWGHVTGGSAEASRIARTIELFRTEGYDWAEGKRLPEHLLVWTKEMGHDYPEWWYNSKGALLSHAVSDNMYSPFRWRANQPMGVLTGGFMERAVHPVYPRLFTYREGARIMGLPDSWSLAPIVMGRKNSWLGKAVPVASGRWIGTQARNCIAGTPGEYAGVEVEPKHRVIDVTNAAKVRDIEHSSADNVWWEDRPRTHYSYAPVGFTGRPESYSSDVFTEHTENTQSSQTSGMSARTSRTTPRASKPASALSRPAPVRDVAQPIERVDPEIVSAFISKLGLRRDQAAKALGVSVSRVAEMTGRHRPNSWVNVTRWPDMQEKLVVWAQTS